MPVEVEKAIEGLKEEGRLEGEIKGEIKTYVNLMRKGLISEEVVISNLNISKEELQKRLKDTFPDTGIEVWDCRI